MAPKKEKKDGETVEKKSTQPPKPDEEAFKKRIAEVVVKIDAKRQEMKKVAEKIDGLSSGKAEYESQKAELYERMNATKAKQTEIVSAKKELKEAEFQLKMSKKNQEQELKRLGKDTAAANEQSIIENIRAMEWEMQTATMPLKEEKLLLKKIKEAKAKIPEAQRLAAEYERVKAQSEASAVVQDPTKSSVEQIAALEQEISKLKDQQNKEFNDIQELKKTREGKVAGVKDEIEKKKKIKEEIEALQAEREAIFEEKKGMQKAFNVWEKEQRLEKQRKWAAEQARLDAEWEAEQAKRELEKPNPWLDEITLLEQTVNYCQNMLPKEEKAEEARKEIDHSIAPPNAKVLPSKKDRDEVMFFVATKKKNLKQKNKETKSQAIKHTADTFAIFEKLKVQAPMNTADIAPLMENLQGQLDKLQSQAKAWEEERKAKMATIGATAEKEKVEAA